MGLRNAAKPDKVRPENEEKSKWKMTCEGVNSLTDLELYSINDLKQESDFYISVQIFPSKDCGPTLTLRGFLCPCMTKLKT